jgi:hypothetical protein
VRYPVAAAAFFTWERTGGTLLRGEGTTRDISLRSVYVLSETCPPIDVFIEMRILLPRPSPAPGLSIVGKLRTLRIEGSLRGKRTMGFSAVGKGFAMSSSPNRRLTIMKPGASHKNPKIEAIDAPDFYVPPDVFSG